MLRKLLLKGRVICGLVCCLLLSLAASAQTRITGKVIGADDQQPIIGASVRLRGTTFGTVTDAQGNFAINAARGQVLTVSYIGYQTKEITVGEATRYNISLTANNNELTQVVVTGYLTQVKKDVTGAVATVDVGDAKKIPTTSSESILQGQASGVTVINQGAPGAASYVQIRGIGNFGNSQPLYVIDGVQSSNMSQVNPNDIESISVLKDAGSAAIYGVSGGNGVIVVTTKKGKAGKTVLTYDAYYGDQVPIQGNVWHLMNPTQQMQLSKEAGDSSAPSLYDPNNTGTFTLPTYGYHGTNQVGNFGSAGVTNDPSIVQYYHFDAANPNNDFLVQKFNQQGTDWFHAVFKHAFEQSHTVTASGGNDHNTFLYSLQYLDQRGTLIETFERRYQARVNNTYSVLNNHVRFGENGWVFYRENNGGYGGNQQQEGGSISETYRTMPLIPVYDVAGNYGGGFDGPSGEPLGNSANPVAIQMRSKNDIARSWNMQGTVFAEADFLKYFTVRTAFSGNAGNTFYNTTGYNTYENYESHTNPNSYTEVAEYYWNYNYTNTLTYKQIIGKNNIQALAGYEIKETGGQQLGAYATNFFSLDPSYLTAAATTNSTSINLSNNTFLYQPFSTESVFGQVNYAYNDRYLLGATVRRDGYSAFASGRQWGTFPSISLGYRIAQEDFMKSTHNWLNDLKLRASYGTSGYSGNIGGANAVNTYNSSTGTSYYGIGGGLNSISPGFFQQSIGNPYTTWETDKMLNIGVDFSLFNHFDASVEFYKKTSSNLLFQVPLPSTVGGASAPYVNIGQVVNKGVDIQATYHDVVGRDFRFSIGANITSYQNKITALSPSYIDLFTGSRIGGFVRQAIGEPMGEFYGYKVAGIYQNQAQVNSLPGYSGAAPGSFIYADVNHDGKIDANDRTFIGNPNPDFTYGVNLNASYKRFDFAAVFYGSYGGKIFNYIKDWTDFYNSFPGGKDIDLLTKSAQVVNNQVTNPGATQPAVTYSQPMGSTIPSSFYVESGSFLKCRVAQLGYNFDPGMLKSVGVDRLRLYFQITNLFTITKYSGLDPELVPSTSNLGTPNSTQSTGVDWGAYPNNQKTYMLGVNLSF